MTAFPKVARLIRQKEGDDILLVGGGIIPDEDKPLLEKHGITGNYGPGTPLKAIIEHVKRLHEKGEITIRRLNPGELVKFKAKYSEQLREFAAHPLDPKELVFFDWVHEGRHVLDWSNTPIAFQKFQRFLKPYLTPLPNMPGKLVAASSPELFKSYLKTFFDKQRQKEFVNSDGSTNLSKAKQAFMAHSEDFLKKYKNILLVTEIHSLLFDTRALKKDREFHAFLRTAYPHLLPTDFEKFMRIKNSILGLYAAFNGDPFKVSGFVGSHSESVDNFIEKAEEEMTQKRVSKSQVDAFDSNRRKTIAAAILSQTLK